MIKVLIADDHTLFREGLQHILEQASDMQVVGEATDATSTIALVRCVTADVLVLDLNMPGRSGVELISQIRREMPALKVLVLTMHAEEQYAIRAFRSGAMGYLTKEGAAKELESAIKKIASGGTYMTPTVAELLVQNLGSSTEMLPHLRLSDREFDVFLRLARGNTITHIADELHISKKTVSTHKARILERMGLPNEAALIHYAVRHNLL
ncbi:response regulator [Ralstonia sp. UBA689]|uniref:response regulator n=1 Tax=Ralstonia sp. UBA689 TaxID=1947373 RepID=UPI0025F8889E|nr:response regulator transcription factor [Ralstonia sp. UBA689]